MIPSSTSPRPPLVVALIVVLASFGLVEPAAAAPGAAPRLAFASSDYRDIQIVDSGTGERRTVVSAGNFHVVVDPSWSPDGRRLAFGDTLGVVEPVLGELRIVDVERYRTRTVLSLPTLFVDHVAWSPRGDRIAFSTSTVYTPLWGVVLSHRSVHVVDVDGTDHIVLGPGTDPSWSPDGTRVAFASVEDVLVVNPDDLAATLTVGIPLAFDSDPRWSPDGTRLAFTTSGPTGSPMLWVARADGTDLHPLPVFTYSPPTWSPDGRALAYVDRGIVAVDVASGARRRLSFDEDFGSSAPAWGPSGEIAFLMKNRVEAIDATTRARRVLVDRSAAPRLAWRP